MYSESKSTFEDSGERRRTGSGSFDGLKGIVAVRELGIGGVGIGRGRRRGGNKLAGEYL